ncbi:kinase-like domain-containing protein [Trichoderma sp. SZMC 28015]
MENSEISYSSSQTSGSKTSESPNATGIVLTSDSSVAAVSQGPADSSSDTELLSISPHEPSNNYGDIITFHDLFKVKDWLGNAFASDRSIPAQRLLLPLGEEASGGASSYESDQESCDGGANTQDAPGTTSHRSLQRLALESSEHVINLVATDIGMGEMDFVQTKGEPLVLDQTESNTGFHVVATLCLGEEDSAHQGSNPTVQMAIYFDPNSDSVMLLNKTSHDGEQFITIKRQLASPEEASIRIESFEGAMLGPAPYNISWSGEPILDMTVLPRRYISLDPQNRKPKMNSRKRALEEEDDDEEEDEEEEDDDDDDDDEELASQSTSPPAKRPKTKETSDEPDAGTAVQVKQPTNDVVAASGSTASSDLEFKFDLIADLCHPLEELKLHGSIRVATRAEDHDYTLVREGDVAVQPNWLAFPARHSGFPRKAVVVKTLRSHSGTDLDTVSTGWLNEVKNHSQVSKHRAIASFYGSDARFMALYQEHIDAPSLSSYIESNGNPYCNLNSRDARRVLLDMTDAVNFIHRKGITHNDIKPFNIAYSRERRAVLLDFGLATTGSVHSNGTRWYVPPEYAIRGTRGPPGDIFALGVVLLFLLRKIPLPEKQSPPLVWPIRCSSGSGPEVAKALDAMNRWKEIFTEAAGKLKEMVDDEIHPEVLKVVSRMVEVEVEERATGDEIVETLREYDDYGRNYTFAYMKAENY